MKDNHVISEADAKRITGGHVPLALIPLEEAIQKLDECVVISEAKFWTDAGDALAAWAKIYRDDRASLKAKRLKLHAYRRMGELARELRPGGVASSQSPAPETTLDGETRRGRWGPSRFSGRLPGPTSLLLEEGLSKTQSQSALRLSRLDKDKFDAAVNNPRPPSPVTLGTYGKDSSNEWEYFGTCFYSTRSFCRRHDPIHLAKQFKQEEILRRAQGLKRSEVDMAREIAREIIEWLDRFEAALPPPTVGEK